MTTTDEIDLTKLSDAMLLRWQAYWMRRLHSRGGGWLAEDMAKEAVRMLAQIERVIETRPTLEKRQP